MAADGGPDEDSGCLFCDRLDQRSLSEPGQGFLLQFDPAIGPAGFQYLDGPGEVLSRPHCFPPASEQAGTKGVVFPQQKDPAVLVISFYGLRYPGFSLRGIPVVDGQQNVSDKRGRKTDGMTRGKPESLRYSRFDRR